MNPSKRFACLLGGFIGDCVGNYYENNHRPFTSLTHFTWQTSDDTQLTLATCEALLAQKLKVIPEKIAQTFLTWFQQNKLSGLGASTLGALQALQVGGHWALVGRSGEFGAGNGAAMRIAPLAFLLDGLFDRQVLRDVVIITHKNEEAYCGALAIFHAIQIVLENSQITPSQLCMKVIEDLPDSKVRDQLIGISQQAFTNTCQTIAAQFGCSGYVAESVPLAIFAAARGLTIGFEQAMEELCQAGGDADTNCAMAGQIIGAAQGLKGIPQYLQQRAKKVAAYQHLVKLMEAWNRLTGKV